MEGEICNDAAHSLSKLSLSRSKSGTDKRRLLLIYIHGFMGSEASFHDLPAHVHDLLTGLLSESHEVYTRIYPRYKSYGEMHVAAEQFSAWLSPHEADDLDVILLGHSLGGILAADVALLQARDHQPKHRILGLVNFDVPFLGLHPRVIPTGTSGSVAKKDPAAEDKLAGAQESLGMEPAFKPGTSSPNFDPPFMNDVRLVERGFFKGLMHFVNKNTDNLSRSIFDRVVSSFKHAGCVNNYPELRRRYRHLADLEAAESSPKRVRFVNYYTASTGRPPKPPKKKKTKSSKKSEDVEDKDSTPTPSEEPSETPSVSEEDKTVKSTSESSLEGQELKPTPSNSTLVGGTNDENTNDEKTNIEKEHPLDTRSIASSTSTDKKGAQSMSESMSITTSMSSGSSDTSKDQLRKFILLPSHHWKYERNAHWHPILMEGMDEVTAHQSMFIPQGANYDHLVGDTVSLIERWIQSDLSRRFLLENLD
ncbi:hypothetical protein N7522_005996 [Penicillium canescens]|nr:hypothetical protein N7522_005996 [Penicillium canescens]